MIMMYVLARDNFIKPQIPYLELEVLLCSSCIYKDLLWAQILKFVYSFAQYILFKKKWMLSPWIRDIPECPEVSWRFAMTDNFVYLFKTKSQLFHPQSLRFATAIVWPIFSERTGKLISWTITLFSLLYTHFQLLHNVHIFS